MPHHNRGPIFIFASGQRCGSTLLQRLLVSHPQIMIWGEHDGVLGRMFTQFDRLFDWERMFGHQYLRFKAEGYNNFIPNMNPDLVTMQSAQKKLVENLFEKPAAEMGCSIWGFKEVKYGAEMALQLKALFPTAKIIHLTRNIYECFISLKHEEMVTPEEQPHVPIRQVWTRGRTIEFIDTWVEVNKSMMESPDLEDDWVCHLKYETLIEDPEQQVYELSNWLGLAKEDFDMAVFGHKIYTDRHKGHDPRPKIRRADLAEEEHALLQTKEVLHISELLGYDMRIEPYVLHREGEPQ